MNKVITINLGGTAFQLEEGGYDALRAYLDSARARLHGNPDCDEILSDIERAIGEKFAAQLNVHKNVVLASEVTAVVGQMGPIQDYSANAASADSSAGASAQGSASTGGDASSAGPATKRLYRIYDGAMVSGVCNGLGAYFNLDPTLIRLAAVLLTLFWGVGILVYLVMVIVVPSAVTPEQKAAATGGPWTAQDFIRRARAGYYDAVRSFPDRHARRAWKRQFWDEMRAWRMSFHQGVAVHGPRWRENWAQYQAAHPGFGLMLPVLSLARALLLVLMLCALVSLLATGTVFGAVLPAGLPVWAAALLLLIGYGIVVVPLQAARRAFYYGAYGAPGATWPAGLAFDALIGIALIGFLLWLAMHHSGDVRAALHQIPSVLHDAVHAVRDWWRGV